MSSNLVQFLNQYSHKHFIESINKEVNVRPITTGQMKSILVYEGETSDTIIDYVLDDLIAGCLSDKSVDIDSITIQDRFELMLYIRQITKGEMYNFTTKCDKCNKEILNFINLKELPKKEYSADIEWKVKLSPTITAKMSYITRGIQKQAQDIIKDKEYKKDSHKIADLTTHIYALSIVEFETPAGVIKDASPKDVVELLDNLPESDYNKISEWFEKNDYGTEFRYKETCHHCGHISKEYDIPLSGFFF